MNATHADLIRDSVTGGHLADYLTAGSGESIAVYADGSVHVGESVGREIDPGERPVALARCPGLGNTDMSWWRAGWDCDHLDDAAVIRDCCAHGDVAGELEDLIARLIADAED